MLVSCGVKLLLINETKIETIWVIYYRCIIKCGLLYIFIQTFFNITTIMVKFFVIYFGMKLFY